MAMNCASSRKSPRAALLSADSLKPFMETTSSLIQVKEGRFARFEAIEWWDQELLSHARVLVIGAGALGNEVIKNLTLLGVGKMVIVDMDRVELSNLSRSVLFREQDEGHPKAVCAAERAQQIFPKVQALPVVGNVQSDLGLGYFRWANAVIGALDNREARVFVNGACARVGRPWFDGGIEVLHGIVRGFQAPQTACYECTMSKVDWELLNKRRSCSLLARRAIAERGTPTTPTTASVIAGIQVQEVVKLLHNQEALLGKGFVFEGAHHSSYKVNYQIDPQCSWHDPLIPIEAPPRFSSSTMLQEIWDAASDWLGGLDAIDLAREIVDELHCPACGTREQVLQTAEKLREGLLLCPRCQKERAPSFLHSIPKGSNLLHKTIREIGLPGWDIVWPRLGAQTLGFEMKGDDPFMANQWSDK